MPAQKLHEEFTPGRGYTREDWDEVSNNPELTDEELAQGKPFAEMFPGVDPRQRLRRPSAGPIGPSSRRRQVRRSSLPRDSARDHCPRPRHVRCSQGSRRNPRGALQSPVGGRRSEAEHAFRRRPRSRAEADNQRSVGPMAAELRG